MRGNLANVQQILQMAELRWKNTEDGLNGMKNSYDELSAISRRAFLLRCVEHTRVLPNKLFCSLSESGNFLA